MTDFLLHILLVFIMNPIRPPNDHSSEYSVCMKSGTFKCFKEVQVLLTYLMIILLLIRLFRLLALLRILAVSAFASDRQSSIMPENSKQAIKRNDRIHHRKRSNKQFPLADYLRKLSTFHLKTVFLQCVSLILF